ncbi:MAG: PH domain-containing protein [Phycisphaerales bacterium]|nr:PH domain-containing protein [Phycisphaerales bacterium]
MKRVIEKATGRKTTKNLPSKRSTTLPGLAARRSGPTPLTEAQGAGSEALPAVDLLPAHLLDGDEIVILAVKPSLWFIVFTSARWLLGLLILLLLAGWLGHRLSYLNRPLVIQAAVALSAARVGLAMLQWVSRLYVLTNRRVMRIRGILNIDLFECPLTKIQNTYVTLAWYERITRLGTIAFTTAGTAGIEACWTQVNNPLELHERLRSAINRAQRPTANGL